MVKLLIYGYCIGRVSSRKIEEATHTDVGFRVLACNQHPDHDSIADFRKRHLGALGGLFVQVLELCGRAGLIKLGHVAIDGTKVLANASKHKAMSYERMKETEKRLEAEVTRLLKEATELDAAEDARYGKGRRGDELPAELARRESRLRKIREAKASLEEEARKRAAEAALEAEAEAKKIAEEEEETGRKLNRKKPQAPDPEEAEPKPTAQRNFTDGESRIMRDGASGTFVQAYNAQAAVDGEGQVIVAALVTQEGNDKRMLLPVSLQIRANLGVMPQTMTADAGYFNSEQMTADALNGVDLYVSPDRQTHASASETTEPSATPDPSLKGQMRAKLRTEKGRAIYKQRKATVEPVFGQIKERRGFRRFSFRGKEKISAEWNIVCLTHNLLKLFRHRMTNQAA